MARPPPTPITSTIAARATWLIDQWIPAQLETWAQALIDDGEGR